MIASPTTSLRVNMDAMLLLNALKDCKKVVQKRSQLSILNYVLFTVQPYTTQITTTNLDLTLTRYLVSDGSTSGAICLPLKPLFAFIKQTKKDEQITLSIDENLHAVVTREKDHVSIESLTLDALDAQEFPRIPEPPQDALQVTLASQDMAKLIKRTSFACAHDKARPVFTALHLRLTTQRLRAEAADTYRLAIQDISILNTTVPKELGEIHLLPYGAELSTLTEILSKTGNVTLRFFPGHMTLFIDAPGFQASCYLMEGIYPNTEALFSSFGQQDSQITCTREDLLTFLTSFQGTGSLVCTLSEDHQHLLGVIKNDTQGSQERICVIQEGTVQPHTTHFLLSHLHLLDGVTIFPPKSLITLAWNEPCGHGFFLTSQDLCGFTYVTMPFYSRG